VSEWEPDKVELFRPVGQREFDLIRESEFKAFPKQLAHQPILFPVLTNQYAEQIARDWNTKDEAAAFAGYVARFHVSRSFISEYEVHTVGSSDHREYWIPAEDLEELNRCLVGPIEIVATFVGTNNARLPS